MGCYCGLETQANRVKWLVAAVLFTLAWACLTITSTIESSCYKENPDAMGCLIHPESRADCIDQKEALARCIADKMPLCGLLGFAFLVLIIAAPIPLCMMCCCGQPPSQTWRVQSVAAPVYPPSAQPVRDQDDSQQPLLLV